MEKKTYEDELMAKIAVDQKYHKKTKEGKLKD
jgi:hypothetical protein